MSSQASRVAASLHNANDVWPEIERLDGLMSAIKKYRSSGTQALGYRAVHANLRILAHKAEEIADQLKALYNDWKGY